MQEVKVGDIVEDGKFIAVEDDETSCNSCAFNLRSDLCDKYRGTCINPNLHYEEVKQ